MKNKYLGYFFSLILIVFSGCLEPIELDIPKGFQESLIIEGKIVKGEPSTFELYVSQLFNFTPESGGRINARDAIIMDEDGNEMEIDPVGQGVYFYEFTEEDPIKIEFGQSYKVQIGTFDGRVFESTFEPLLPGPEIANLRFEKIEKESLLPDQSIRIDSFIQFRIDTDLSAPGMTEKSYLKWDLQRVYQVTDFPIPADRDRRVCYISENVDVTNIRIFNGPGQAGDRLNNFELVDERLSRKFGEGYYFIVVQESLSEAAYNYWDNNKKVVEREGDIFADPAGKVKSNFVNLTDPNEEAFGYFYATFQDTVRAYISPEFAGNQPSPCPSPGQVNEVGMCIDNLCCNCASLPNSVTVKPYFWID